MAAMIAVLAFMVNPLSDKDIPSGRGACASMDIAVTIQAAAGIHPIGWGNTPERVLAGVGPSGMARGRVAALTELGHPARQELSMVAAVDGMAGPAVLFHRRMLPEERTALLRVAAVAEFVDRLGLDHLPPETAVLVMAVRALHPPLLEGVVGLLGDLDPHIPVAGDAELGLGGLQIFFLAGVEGVATVAGNPRRFVLAHVPEGHSLGFRMAGQTFFRFRVRLVLALVEGEDAGPLAPALLDVELTRAVAGLAPQGICRAVADLLVGMDGLRVAVEPVRMAHLAGLCSPARFSPMNLPGHTYPNEQGQSGK
jgi:hypothetical protein